MTSDIILNIRAKQQQKRPIWKVKAYFLDACNCDWGCPCQFNAKPTHRNCEGVAGYHIVTGIYGTTVKLDGLNMALIASWPGPIHEGHGRASFYIDNRANEKQFEALSNIITGRAGGGPFEVYASTIEKLQEPKKARIKFQSSDLRSRVSVFDKSGEKKPKRKNGQDRDIIAEARLEPIRNPITGKIHRAIIEIPEGFESSRMEQASTRMLVANDDNLSFQYVGTYGSFSENTWKGP
ncbi:MAG TPA: DUF1326 domain-containing protein [Nitrososphaeraceae archaeon]